MEFKGEKIQLRYSSTLPDYAIFLHSLSLYLAEAQVLVDPNLLIMSDYVVVEYYIIVKQTFLLSTFDLNSSF